MSYSDYREAAFKLLQRLPLHISWQGNIGTRVFLCDSCWAAINRFVSTETDSGNFSWTSAACCGRRTHVLSITTKGYDCCGLKPCPGCGTPIEGGEEVYITLVMPD